MTTVTITEQPINVTVTETGIEAQVVETPITVEIGAGGGVHGIVSAAADTHTTLYDSGGTSRVILGTVAPQVIATGRVSIPTELQVGQFNSGIVDTRGIFFDFISGSIGLQRLLEANLTTPSKMTANGTLRSAIAAIGALDMNGKTLASLYSFEAGIGVDNVGASSTLTDYVGVAINRNAVGNVIITNTTGLEIGTMDDFHISSGTVRGVHIRNQIQGAAAATLMVAVDIEDQSGATTNRSIRVQGTAPSIHQPSLLIGANAAAATSAVLELQSTTGALLLPRMTTAQRDALTAVDGMQVYNTTTAAFNKRQGGAWVAF